MAENKPVRKPQQKRSIETKEKILSAAYALFCEKGYFSTTTNEIAKVAKVSIGSLYAYYKDKDTILLDILERYNQSFLKVHEDLSAEIELYKNDPKKWLRLLIENLIEVHQTSKALNREMEILCFTMPQVAAAVAKQREKTWQTTLDSFHSSSQYITAKDPEAAAIITFNLISSIVDQIVFFKNEIDEERILQTGIDTVYHLLMC